MEGGARYPGILRPECPSRKDLTPQQVNVLAELMKDLKGG